MNESMINESIIIMANQRLASIIWQPFVVISMLMSVTQMVVICVWKPLRTLDHILIFFIAASDFCKAITHGTLSAQRIYLADNGLYEARTQLQCIRRLLPIVMSSHVVMASMLMISLDRLTALTLPIWYSRRKGGIKIFCVIASIVSGIGYGSLLLVGAKSDEYQVACSVALSTAPATRAVLNYTDNLWCGVIVLINMISCTVVCWRWRRAMLANENMAVVKNNMQLKALKTLMAILVLFLISVYANMICVAGIASLPITEMAKRSYTPVSGCANLLRGVFDFPIYLLMCREYRAGFRAIFIRSCRWPGDQGNSVSPIAKATVSVPNGKVARKPSSILVPTE